ncbi:serine/threonine-protein kinase NIM1-like isoform X2 [Artemia franciscana]|uniref:non-specific serine/threonine protein kinase n=1 Tax=Artemia franciscana TaxID=6661 RepID=A0AA88LJM2_ARTSF|nr:hypothetical protein QYM36_000975 [Artemia franciscana]
MIGCMDKGPTQPLLPLWTQHIGQPLSGTWPSVGSGGVLLDEFDSNYTGEGSSLYDKLIWAFSHDPKWQREIALGKRVGFYKFRGEVGSGNFSKVKLAFHQLTHERVAIKIIDKVGLDSKGLVMLSREIESMTKLDHPHIVRLFEVVETLSRVHLVMDYAPYGELYNQIMTEGALPENEARLGFFQLVSAVEYMHDQGIVHRDIKAENVFIYEKNCLKLGDFGFTTCLKSLQEALDTFCGSPPYAAPELFTEDTYIGQGVDIWALGVLLYFMVCGRMPFEAQTVVGLKTQILDGKLSYQGVPSKVCEELISAILKPKASDRFSLKEIKEHPWMIESESSLSVKKYDRESLEKLVQDMEEKTRQELNELGISHELLKNEIQKGSRSPVIGAYRIILQRNLRNTQKQNKLDSGGVNSQSNASSPSQKNPEIKISPSSPQKQTRRKLKQKITLLAANTHNHKSKSCSIM